MPIMIQLTETYQEYAQQGQGYIEAGTRYQRFLNIHLYRQWVKVKYRQCKRQGMYIDTKDGRKKVGTVFCYKDDFDKCWRQDWIEVFRN